MEMERPQAEQVARQDQATPLLIPQGEREFTHQPADGVVPPFQQAFEENIRVGALGQPSGRHSQRFRKLFPIVETNVSDELERPPA